MLRYQLKLIAFIMMFLSLVTAVYAANKGSDIEPIPDMFSLSRKDMHGREGIFFGDQNGEKTEFMQQIMKGYGFEERTISIKDITKKIYINSDIKMPVIEFKKINPVKYRIRIHNATNDFPLILNESYHDGWKAYINGGQMAKIEDEKKLEQYKILEGNEAVQAQKEELKEFVKSGWISTLGNGAKKEQRHKRGGEKGHDQIDRIESYYIDFISTNIKNSIQNNNLPDGRFYETWGKKAIPDDYHWMANGFANSWWIVLEQIKKSKEYRENPDGSIDFEIILEFWPQRIFYIGLFISCVTLFGCLTYLIYNRIKHGRSIQ